MRLNVIIDQEHFIVHLNNMCIKNEESYSVHAGDIIRITSNFERNFFLNGEPIGLFDKKDDALYQNEIGRAHV